MYSLRSKVNQSSDQSILFKVLNHHAAWSKFTFTIKKNIKDKTYSKQIKYYILKGNQVKIINVKKAIDLTKF